MYYCCDSQSCSLFIQILHTGFCVGRFSSSWLPSVPIRWEKKELFHQFEWLFKRNKVSCKDYLLPRQRANQNSTWPYPVRPWKPWGDTSLIFNHDNTAANHIRGNTFWIILSDPILCSCVAINYNFGTQLICLRAWIGNLISGSLTWFPLPINFICTCPSAAAAHVESPASQSSS